jgi:ribosomal subunit interface protein
MDITISGRRCTVSDEAREEVADKVESQISKLSGKATRVEIEFTANPTESETQAEITLRGKGPVVRASGAADDKLVAFDIALDKLKTQLRKAADRRKAHRGLRVADLGLAAAEAASETAPAAAAPEAEAEAPKVRNLAGLEVQGDGPLVVREKKFSSAPLTLAQALDEMELVGHDFFLYVDAETRAPSVVYRRRAYDYGVIHLEVTE